MNTKYEIGSMISSRRDGRFEVHGKVAAHSSECNRKTREGRREAENRRCGCWRLWWWARKVLSSHSQRDDIDDDDRYPADTFIPMAVS